MARIHGITSCDTQNVYWGMAVSIFFNHCPHKCIGCFNPETWAKDDSLEMDNDEIVETLLTELDRHFAKDLTLLGGDPFSPLNKADVTYIVKQVKERRPETRILAWTGFRWENKWLRSHPILPLIDILIDGRFVQKLFEEGHKFGSTNQRVIDVKASITRDEIIEVPESFDKNIKYGA